MEAYTIMNFENINFNLWWVSDFEESMGVIERR